MSIRKRTKHVLNLRSRVIFAGLLAQGLLDARNVIPWQVQPQIRRPLSSLPIVAKIVVPGAPDWIGIGFGSVWVSNPATDTVSRIDPYTYRVVAKIAVGKNPSLGVGIGYDSVWITNCGDHTVSRIDPQTNKVAETFPVNISGDGEGSIAVGEDGIWLTTNENGTRSGTFTRLDPVTHHILANISVAADSHGVVVGDGAIWVTSTAQNTVSRIDPRTNTVVATIAVHQSPRFLASGEGAVWVLNQGDGTVSRIDPQTNRVIATIAVGVPGPGGDIAVGNNFVWVSANGIPVSRIDPRTNKLMEQYVGGDGADAIRAGFGSLWVSDHKRGEVWRIDLNKLLGSPEEK